MPALIVLLAAVPAFVVMGVVRDPSPAIRAGVGGLAALAALAAAFQPATLLDLFSADGAAAIPLFAAFLLTAAGAVPPLLTGVAALFLLAGNGLLMVAAAAVALVLAPPAALPAPRWVPRWGRVLLAVSALLLALLCLAGLDPVLRPHAPPQGVPAVLAPLAATVAAGVLAASLPEVGGLLATALLARLLLIQPGPVTPGWWGVPVLLLGAAMAGHGAYRAGSATSLSAGAACAGRAVQGLSVLALGAALLSRGADLLPLSSASVTAAFLLLLAWALWAAPLALGAEAIENSGGAELGRLGGVLRRAPLLGSCLLLGLASAAFVPLTPGFSALFLTVQSVLGAARAGGLGVLLLVAAAASLLGLVVAALAAAMTRLAGLALLGAPRSARAAALSEPSPVARLLLLGLTAASGALALVPGLGLVLVRPGTALLAAGPVSASAFTIGLPDGPGFAAIGLLLLLAVLTLAVVPGLRGPAAAVTPWQGGFAEDGVGRGNAGPAFRLSAVSRSAWPVPPLGFALLLAGVLALAFLLGWAAH